MNRVNVSCGSFMKSFRFYRDGVVDGSELMKSTSGTIRCHCKRYGDFSQCVCCWITSAGEPAKVPCGQSQIHHAMPDQSVQNDLAFHLQKPCSLQDTNTGKRMATQKENRRNWSTQFSVNASYRSPVHQSCCVFR